MTERANSRVDWDPERYRRFASERAQPFHDLLEMVSATPGGTAVDLGCGPGELTAHAATALGCAVMTGIDNSPAMVQAASAHERPGLSFVRGDIGPWTSDHDHDLVLAAASLQWVPDHPGVLARWTRALREGGQLAVQVPDNAHMPTHVVAAELARSEQFRSSFGVGGPPPDPVGDNVLAPERYAELLYELGYVEQHVRLVVYPHVLASSAHVVDWVRATMLRRFEMVLPAEVFAEFLREYERALLVVIGHREPYFFPFRRILFHGRSGAS